MKITIETSKRILTFSLSFKLGGSVKRKPTRASVKRCGKAKPCLTHAGEFEQWDRMTNDGGAIGEYPDWMQPHSR